MIRYLRCFLCQEGPDALRSTENFYLYYVRLFSSAEAQVTSFQRRHSSVQRHITTAEKNSIIREKGFCCYSCFVSCLTSAGKTNKTSKKPRLSGPLLCGCPQVISGPRLPESYLWRRLFFCFVFFCDEPRGWLRCGRVANQKL